MSEEINMGGALTDSDEMEKTGSLDEQTTSLFIENGGDAVDSDDPGGELSADGATNFLFTLHTNGRANGHANGHSNGADGSSTPYSILVHSHLRWDWVWQRPQQFLTRLSARHSVLFVQGPLVEDGEFEPFFRLTQAEGFPNVTLMDSVFPRERFQDGEWVDAQRTRLVQEATGGPLAGKFDAPVQWFYDPMAVPSFLGKMNEQANVYDCMDQLSQFKFAPPPLVERERILLQAADVVFAGGRKMWEDKKKSNANAHFFGCGVDVDHFAKARSPLTEVPDDLASVAGPVLGYFGVVDERMDYELVAKIADARPDWTLAFVGPTCKVEVEDLPKRPNILWLGGRDYEQLPAYTKGFDVCLMPFALNEATEFINPTKALEYMATGRPVVSSAVPDVVSNFSEAVKIAHSHDEFLQLCEMALSNPDRASIEAGLEMAARNSWDSIIAQLDGHVERVLQSKAAKAGA